MSGELPPGETAEQVEAAGRLRLGLDVLEERGDSIGLDEAAAPREEAHEAHEEGDHDAAGLGLGRQDGLRPEIGVHLMKPHTLSVLSRDPDTTRPSGSNPTQLTQPVCPLNVWRHNP